MDEDHQEGCINLRFRDTLTSTLKIATKHPAKYCGVSVSTLKHGKTMATLGQLCPELCALAQKKGGVHTQHSRPHRQRLSNYAYCMAQIESMGAEGLFAACKGVRCAKKAKNSASKEKAGTIGNTITTKRFAGSRLTCVCKSRNIF